MLTFAFIGGVGIQEIVIFAVVLIVLFGGRQVPTLMRNLGSSVSEFRKGIAEIDDVVDDVKNEKI